MTTEQYLGIEMSEAQAELLEGYIMARDDYDTWHEALTTAANWDPSWVYGLDELLASHLSSSGTLTLYRGLKAGRDENDGGHLSWTTDRKVAVWHSTMFGGGPGKVMTFTFDPNDHTDWLVFAAAEGGPEAEVMLDPDFVDWMLDETITVEGNITRPAKDMMSLGEYVRFMDGTPDEFEAKRYAEWLLKD